LSTKAWINWCIQSRFSAIDCDSRRFFLVPSGQYRHWRTTSSTGETPGWSINLIQTRALYIRYILQRRAIESDITMSMLSAQHRFIGVV
jgi:hypothetical protein